MIALFGLALTLTVAAVAAAFHPGMHRVAGASRVPAHVRAETAAPRQSHRPVARGALGARGGVTVWLPYWAMSAAYSSTIGNAGVVRTASPFWYQISGDATVAANPGAGDRGIIAGLHAHDIRVVPTVTETEGMSAFDRTLASSRRRAAMVQALVTIARSRAYDGLDLDFEEFAVDHSHAAGPADQAAAAYAPFVAEVCGALHAIGRSCSVTVMPRTSAAHIFWRGKLATWVYDYGALAKAADRVRIMAYDEHAPGTAPGPVAPYSWVGRVVRYAVSTMAPGKAELALAAYGYDFSGRSAISLPSRQATLLAAQVGATPSWDSGQAEQTFAYGSRRHRHTVWFEDARAEYIRARLAVAAGFAGVDLWYAGGEQPGLWPLLHGLYGH